MDEDLIYEILSVVEEIPEGKVASYGQIARLICRDKNARLVGRIILCSEREKLCFYSLLQEVQKVKCPTTCQMQSFMI